MNGGGKDLAVVLRYLAGGSPDAPEVCSECGQRRSECDDVTSLNARGITADKLIKVARYFGLNPIDLQVRFKLIEPESVVQYVESGLNRNRSSA